MTYLTERQAARLAERLADLPRLAAEAGDVDISGSTVGSQPPPGTDLKVVDAGREQPHLLARLAECVRVVAREEMPRDVFERAPDRPEVVTWAGESQWLIATMGWWQGDDWCAEWVYSEVKVIRHALIGLIEQHNSHRTCGVCAAPVETYQVGDYAYAECPKCERVLGVQDVGYRERIEKARQMLADRLRQHAG